MLDTFILHRYNKINGMHKNIKTRETLEKNNRHKTIYVYTSSQNKEQAVMKQITNKT